MINNESFIDSLKSQGTNILVGALGNVGAKQIGNMAHGSITNNNDGTLTYNAPTIGKGTQLTLHALLGATTSSLAGNDALSGAASGVSGELVSRLAFDYLNENSMDLSGAISNQEFNQNRDLAIQISGLTGGLSSIFVGNAIGLDDKEVANNMWSGQRVGL